MEIYASQLTVIFWGSTKETRGNRRPEVMRAASKT